MFFRIVIQAFRAGTGYRFDDILFNLRKLQARSKVQTDLLDELLCAYEMDLNASTEANM